jgi:hypothetical protein
VRGSWAASCVRAYPQFETAAIEKGGLKEKTSWEGFDEKRPLQNSITARFTKAPAPVSRSHRGVVSFKYYSLIGALVALYLDSPDIVW